MSLIGREIELKMLEQLKSKKTASLICVRGRRRIGKSALIKEFSKKFENYIEIQGLAPREANSNQQQLDHFSKELARKMKTPAFKLLNWSEAFSVLAKLTAKGKYLIFLDEISWMGKYDPDFAGVLKIAWDTEFKLNNNLLLVICGSVSTWIQKNILNNTGYVGRISLNLKLTDLSLKESIKFIRGGRLSEYEQVKILSITGGVPKYLEEISASETAEKNIERLLLNKSGFLFNEYEQIFNDIFDKKSSSFQKILIQVGLGFKFPKEIAKKLKLPLNGDFFEHLDQLCESGFLGKFSTWSIKTAKESNLSHYRISDNFIHFYLKFIYPLRSRVEKLPLKINSFKNWESILGYQFQNLIYNNYESILTQLQISTEEVVQLGPYFQRKNTKQQACQIDLLIQTKFGNLYVCEIKCKLQIDTSVLTEIRTKIKNLSYGKGFTIRPVLITCGEVADGILNSEELFRIVHFKDLTN